MRLTRTIAVAAASVLAAAIAVIGAGAASAASPEPLCVDGSSVCATALGSGFAVTMFPSSSVAPSAWLYNEVPHPGSQIQQAGTSLCLQLDHLGGNIVIEATCNGASYQQWVAAYDNPNDGEVYVSMWDQSQCLTYNASEAILDTVTCQNAWYQAFGS